MEDNILIIKLQGMFFNAYGDNAKVLGEITGYKVKQVSETSQYKCGFSYNALDKVVELLDGAYVNYKIFNKDKIIKKRIENTNMYLDYLHVFSEERIEKPWLLAVKKDTVRKENEGPTISVEDNKSGVSLEAVVTEKRPGFFKKIFASILANALKTQNISDKDKFFALYDTPYQSGRDYINEQYLYEKVMQLLSKNVKAIYSDDVLVTDVIKEAESNK